MIKKKYFVPFVFIMLVAFVLAACSLAGKHKLAGDELYELVWADEFDYEGLPDTSKWVFQVGGHGWGNREKQFYRDSLHNTQVANNLLTITAKKEAFETWEYTSARLITRGKFDCTFGKIESRLKLPFGQGIWPAFWMLGTNISEVGWPRCGEIDIMEMVGGQGRENTTHGTLHWLDSTQKAKYLGGAYTLPQGTFADDFHVYGVEWNPEKIIWYLDTIRFHEQLIRDTSLNEIHKPFYILLNVAVGGNWPGYPDSTTVFPQKMEVDYVRVYQLKKEH